MSIIDGETIDRAYDRRPIVERIADAILNIPLEIEMEDGTAMNNCIFPDKCTIIGNRLTLNNCLFEREVTFKGDELYIGGCLFHGPVNLVGKNSLATGNIIRA